MRKGIAGKRERIYIHRRQKQWKKKPLSSTLRDEKSMKNVTKD